MNIIVFRHFDFDDPAAIVDWAEKGGHNIRILDPSKEIKQAQLELMDLLIILGGPMSVYQEREYPWLIEEKVFVREAIDRGIKVLGICLGAQMIAELLGGTVRPNDEKEIGWHTMRRTAERHPWLAALPETFTSFSWHGDTFTLPAGARNLVYSDACGRQAFAYGEHVLGLQFHLETTPVCIDRMLSNWSHELQDKPYIQSADLIYQGMHYGEQARLLLRRILNGICSSINAISAKAAP